jgi:hypothetical protein
MLKKGVWVLPIAAQHLRTAVRPISEWNERVVVYFAKQSHYWYWVFDTNNDRLEARKHKLRYPRLKMNQKIKNISTMTITTIIFTVKIPRLFS